MRPFQETASAMQAIPKITISRELETPKEYDPCRIHTFRYRAKRHRELPPRGQVLRWPIQRNAPVRHAGKRFPAPRARRCRRVQQHFLRTSRNLSVRSRMQKASGSRWRSVLLRRIPNLRRRQTRGMAASALLPAGQRATILRRQSRRISMARRSFRGDAFAQGVPAKPIQPCLHAISQIGNNPAVPSRLVRKQEEHPIPRAWSRRIAGGRKRITQAPRLRRRRRSQRSPPSQEELRTQPAHWPGRNRPTRTSLLLPALSITKPSKGRCLDRKLGSEMTA